MRAMKDSGIEWIGEIPQGWKTVRIKYVIDRSEYGIKIGPFGSTLANRTLISGPYNVYSQANLISNSFSDTNHFIDRDTFVDLRGYEVKPGDVCVSMMGTIGKCRVVPEGIAKGIMDSHLIKIRLDETQIDPRFFEYVYDKDNSGVCFTQMQYEKKGTIMDGLNTAIVKNLIIPLPPLADQIDISKYLDTKCAEIDALIVAKEKTNALLKERRQSMIYEAVTKGLAPTVPMKDSGVEWIGEIPEGWELKRLKYLGSMQIGLTYSPEEIVADGALVLRSSNIQEGKIVHADDVFVGKEIPEKLKVEEGDILICSRNGSRSLIGKNAVITEEFSGQTFGAFMTIFRSRFNFYIKYLLNSSVFDYYVGSFLTSTINQLTTSNLGNILVPVPSTEEEMWKIAEHIETACRTIDPIIAMNNETIQKLKKYRQSLIYEAVTGKIEV